MNHNEFKQMIQLSLYGELSDDKQKKLISHLESCEECRLELEHQKKIMMLIADHKNLEVNEELLKEARIQLRGALRQERNNRSSVSSFTNYIFQLFSTPPRLAFGAASVLILGIIIGSIFIGREKITATEKNPEFTNTSIFDNDLRISNVQFIDSDPTDGEIEFTFNAVKQMHYKGSVNDPGVQSFLAYAMLNDQNPGSRLNSINAMDTYKKLSLDKEVKNALITVVMTDKNAGVRREALKLMNRTSFDESLKQAYLFVLLNDSSSALRIEALNALIEANKNGHSLDRNDLDLVVKQANQDDNNYIKLKSKTLLQEYN
jgi:hypothetical protein